MSILRRVLTPLSYVVPKKTILFLEAHHGSGSNVFSLYCDLNKDPAVRYTCQLVSRETQGAMQKLRRELNLMRAKWIVQDHGGKAPYPGQKVIEMWHGIPLKAMDSMDINNDSLVTPKQIASSLPDYVLSSSRLYETLMSACRYIPASRYRRFGFPRMRWLKTDRTTARQMIARAIGAEIAETERLILWMPTHRKSKSAAIGHGPSVIPSLLETYLNEDLESALVANNTWLILKPHPNDEESVKQEVHSTRSRIRVLSSKAYGEIAEDLYCLLPGTDALITDYSSVYFDYMLLDKPVGFIVNDLEQYRKQRGFLLEPVTSWMPGPKIEKPSELVDFVQDLRASRDLFQRERAFLKSTFYPEGIIDSTDLIRRHILD